MASAKELEKQLKKWREDRARKTPQQIAADRRSYTFHLRPDVRFHDGSALTSADVVASYERMRNPPAGIASPRREMFAGIAAIEAPDASTVVFRLESENPAMLTVFAANFVRWAQEWVRPRIEQSSKRFEGALSSPKRLVRLAAP